MRRYKVTIRGRELEAVHRRLASVIDASLDRRIDGNDSYEALAVFVSTSTEAAAEALVVANLPDGCWVGDVEEADAETAH